MSELTEYEKAQLRLASAAEAFKKAEAALEAAETEFSAAIDALEEFGFPVGQDGGVSHE